MTFTTPAEPMRAESEVISEKLIEFFARTPRLAARQCLRRAAVLCRFRTEARSLAGVVLLIFFSSLFPSACSKKSEEAPAAAAGASSLFFEQAEGKSELKKISNTTPARDLASVRKRQRTAALLRHWRAASLGVRAKNSINFSEITSDSARIGSAGVVNVIGQCQRTLHGIFQGRGSLLKFDFAFKLNNLGSGRFEFRVQ